MQKIYTYTDVVIAIDIAIDGFAYGQHTVCYTDSQTGRQTDRQTDRQADRQTDRWTYR